MWWFFSLSALYLLLNSFLLFAFRYERVTDSKDRNAADDRTENSCGPQYQSTTLRVLTQFVADLEEMKGVPEDDGMGQQNFLLGSDWHVDMTQLVKEFLRVEEPSIVELLNSQVLIGRRAGVTKLQVLYFHQKFGFKIMHLNSLLLIKCSSQLLQGRRAVWPKEVNILLSCA